MTDASDTAVAARTIPYPEISAGGFATPESLVRLFYPWLIVGAFGLYWLTYLTLEAHNGSSSFGADSILYSAIAYGNIDDRLIRFHPATVALALTWMKIVAPFFAWVAPHHLLAALFAAIGAGGVLAALSAFEVLVPRRYVLVCGMIYASSLGVWYFSGITKSKILTASLATLYIALYLRLREKWSVQGALTLTGVLAAACLNESVSAFLIIIPAVDTLRRRGFDLRAARWIFAHGLVAPVALFVLEVTINGQLAANPANHESGSSVSMFWFYAGMSDHSVASLYSVVLNWLFFNIAAPMPHAYAAVPIWPNYYGYFEPFFSNYFTSFASTGVIILFGVMLVASLTPGWRAERQMAGGTMLPLIAYTAMRGAFFFVFNPAEIMQFSPAVTLPQLMFILVPFTASKFPAKASVLAGFALLLFATNLRFMIGG